MLRNARNRRGLTLIELVVVVAILAILAGLILQKLDILSLKANKAQASSNIAGVARAIQTYRTIHSQYPNGWDSLVTSTTPALWSSLDPQLIGVPVPNPVKLTTSTFAPIATNDEQRSLVRMGITTLYDANGTGAQNGPYFGDQFTVSRTIADGGTYATVNAPADGDATNIVRDIYGLPAVVPAGKKLLAVGFGRSNAMLFAEDGLLSDPPFYANTNQNLYYNRFIVLFEFKTSGSRARLAGVVGADGDRLGEELADFFE